MESDIVLFESDDGQVVLPVRVDAEGREIWLSRAQLATLFGRDSKTIGKHINNSLREELAGQEEVVVAKFATTTKHGAVEGKTQTHLTEQPLRASRRRAHGFRSRRFEPLAWQ